MSLDDFLALTATRLPTATELVGLCDTLGVTFATGDDGSPRIRFTADLKPEAEMLARLLRREPWRSQVIQAKLAPAAPIPEPVGEVEVRFNTDLIERKAAGDRWPPGAWWWRNIGGEWQGIPGTAGERLPARDRFYTAAEVEAVMGPFPRSKGAVA